MFQRVVIVAAWASVALLVYATVMPVGFVYSVYHQLTPLLGWPGMRAYVRFEHVFAFATFGAIFTIAYPRRTTFVCAVVFVSAVALGYSQTFTPDRHGRMLDAAEKIAGGALGIPAVCMIHYFSHLKRAVQSAS